MSYSKISSFLTKKKKKHQEALVISFVKGNLTSNTPIGSDFRLSGFRKSSPQHQIWPTALQVRSSKDPGGSRIWLMYELKLRLQKNKA